MHVTEEIIGYIGAGCLITARQDEVGDWFLAIDGGRCPVTSSCFESEADALNYLGKAQDAVEFA